MLFNVCLTLYLSLPLFPRHTQFKYSRSLKEVAFACRGLSLTDAVNEIATALEEAVVGEVGEELNDFFDEYATKFLEKI